MPTTSNLTCQNILRAASMCYRQPAELFCVQCLTIFILASGLHTPLLVGQVTGEGAPAPQPRVPLHSVYLFPATAPNLLHICVGGWRGCAKEGLCAHETVTGK